MKNILCQRKKVEYKNIYVPCCAFEKDEVMEELSKYSQNAEPQVLCESFVRSRGIACGDDRIYFITNESGETRETSIVIPKYGNIYEINLIDGKTYPVSGNEITLTLSRGEGKVFLCTKRNISFEKRKFGSEFEICFDTGYVNRIYKVDGGIKNIYPKKGEIPMPCGEWQENFSGEVIYAASLNGSVPDGKYDLVLYGVKHFAGVYVDGRAVGEVTMPPYTVRNIEVKSNSVITVKVANTAANACAATDYFDKTALRWVGPYNSNMLKWERKARCGAFDGKALLKQVID